LTKEEFDQYSYHPKDIFAESTLKNLMNSTDWKMSTVTGPLVGNCITTQYLQPGANVIKLFTAVVYEFCNKLECLTLESLSSLV